MPLDIFRLRNRVVADYSQYVDSFIKIDDERLGAYVKAQLNKGDLRGELWPDPVLQLNPAYQMGETLEQLAQAGVSRETSDRVSRETPLTVSRETARFFGSDLQLYQHQSEAIRLGLAGESYVVTTGTGSGKSLTYLIPIVERIFREDPSDHNVRALLIYPMNALINSQLNALERYREENYPDCPIRFARYTGETKHEEREQIHDDPPHILLTNYVMAELMLQRPTERRMLSTATRALRTLVMDELHFYRGRQGADVAMLTRRLQRGADRIQVIGTSATMSSGKTPTEQREEIAELATKFFGQPILPGQVIGETLARVTKVAAPAGPEALRAAVSAPAPEQNADAVQHHPLAAWAEEAFGIEQGEEGGKKVLLRHAPITFSDAVARLAGESGCDRAECDRSLRDVLEAGNAAVTKRGKREEPVFAFRLHQWLASGGSIYSTLSPAGEREFRMERGYRDEQGRVLFPLAFCRECGQDYYLVERRDRRNGERLEPREPLSGRTGSNEDEDEQYEGGFFALEEGGLWSGSDEDLPDQWFDQLKSGPRIKKNRADFRPRRFRVNAGGEMLAEGGTAGWFMAAPFMFCLRCRHAYDRTGSDYRRLASLSQTGRSTATTVAVNAAVAGIDEQAGNAPGVQAKALSFTDNRQDASLQAGHLNDFVQVALLRSALAEAVREHGPLGFGELGQRVFEALDPAPEDFLKDPVEAGPGYEQGRRAMIDLLEYRALEDLARGWRVNQPNLEQAGLLRIRYEGLDELAADDSRWDGIPLMREAESETRERVLHAILDRLRIELAIDAKPLTRESLRRMTRDAAQWLREPWALEETDERHLRRQKIALLPGEEPRRFERDPLKLTSRSAIGRFLAARTVWGRDGKINADAAEELVEGIVEQLVGQVLSAEREGGRIRGVRVNAGAMRWVAGDGSPVPDDPVRQRALPDAGAEPKAANAFFQRLYRERPGQLRRMLADAHTGQIATEARQERERRFREGALPALFCSPTMELGVDIADLNAVHLRNVPPTPANYAQRSGRAGRNGNPALILAFAAQGNAHDQYFFKRRNEMIAGSVEPARIDLKNEELVRAHLHAIWMGEAAPIGSDERSIRDILDLGDPECPLQERVRARIEPRRHIEAALRTARRIIDECDEIKDARWYRDANDWAKAALNEAPRRFDAAFKDWRQLYRGTVAAREDARREMDDPYGSVDQRQQARRREERISREIDLLFNARTYEESDYYPYRYLATAGFLPGYNFPRLPVRVSVTVRDGVQHITRPRFLGLTEFGPGNLVYHEGRRHRVDVAVVPANGFEWKTATFCNACGHAHDEEEGERERELCGHCSARLDGASAKTEIRLLPQPTMRARPVDRISSDEEERTRNGYQTSIHFDQVGERDERTAAAGGEPLLDLEYAPAARLWQINHKWKSAETDGFEIVESTGEWIPQTAGGRKQDGKKRIIGIKPFVRDTRNLLFLRPRADGDSDAFLVTLQHALQRAIEIKYQLEEQEIAADRIGEGEHRRLLFWEASEGGSGVWEQLIDPDHPDAVAAIARQALELMHYDPETGEDNRGDAEIKCSAGCYECLLSYANQLDHAEIDRRVIRKYLVDLAGSMVEAPAEPDRDARYRHLAERIDSSFEQEVLDHLRKHGHRLPDQAQARPAKGLAVQVDFFYKREDANGVCVFVDGPAHDDPAVREADSRKSEELDDLGFRVIRITYTRPLDEQIAEHADVFGESAG